MVMTEKTRQRKSATPKVETEEVTDIKSNIDEVITVKLDELNTEMEKQYGAGLKKKSGLVQAKYLHTGSFDIDLKTLGGLVDGRLNQIKGFESTGKTTLAMGVARRAQIKHPDKTVVFIDTETHLDPDWVTAHNIDEDKFQVIDELVYAEAYANVFDALLKTGECSLIILDSIASMVPADLIEKNTEEHVKVAALASIVSKMCSSIVSSKQHCAQSGLHFPAIIFINQYRDKIGGYAPNGIVPKTDNGGKHKNFTATTTLELAKPKNIELADSETGDKRTYIDEQKFTLIKAKTGSYNKKGELRRVVSNAHPRLEIGQYEESPKVVKYAKKLGLISPITGSNRKLAVFPDKTFGKDSDIALALEADQEAFDLCKAAIVALIRKSVGKPMIPPDDYLMGFSGTKINEVIVRGKQNVAANEKK